MISFGTGTKTKSQKEKLQKWQKSRESRKAEPLSG